MVKKTITVMIVAVTCLSIFLAGCANDAQTGTVVGTLAGAGIGQLAGRSTEATLIGAAVGAAGGYMIGNESDKQKSQAEVAAVRRDMNSQIVNVTNSNGSIVQVRLQRHGVGWVGTRGEYYPTLPTENQLRPVYGF